MSHDETVIYENADTRLSYNDGIWELRHRGKTYTFGCQPYEPMAKILEDGQTKAYIHNAFDPDYECQQFASDPKHLCCTITGNCHDAQHFCRLLTTAIDCGFEWQIDELENEMFTQILWENREIFYKTDDIEFGRCSDDMDDDKVHFEYDIMYIIVDGKEYHLEDANMKKLGQLGIFEAGRRKPKIRIHGTNGSVIAAYSKDWRSGEVFTPFGRPCNTKMFCNMIAFAIRDGKSDYDMIKLEKLRVLGT